MTRNRILYVIDERGLPGGAHIATELLIAALQKRDYTIDVMEAVRRNSFWGIVQRASARIIKIFHLHPSTSPLFLRDPFGFKYRQMLRYDTVCVMSETSVLSSIVAMLPTTVHKVQLIHTNYPLWAKFTHRDIEADGKLFAKFDTVGCVGFIGAKQFEDMFPACKGKVVPFHNIIKQDKQAIVYQNMPHQPHSPVRLISLSRINDTMAKDGPRMIRMAKRLHDAGLKFIWDNYGGSGRGFVSCQHEVERLGLSNVFRIHPFDINAPAKIANADIFVLLSHYEGLPNVIYESLLAGTPVFATAVGGVPEQIQNGFNGWIVDDDDEQIYTRLACVCQNTILITNARTCASKFTYDNVSAIQEHVRILTNKETK